MTAAAAPIRTLDGLFAGLDVLPAGLPPQPLSGLACDSRQVRPGGLFLACVGGHRHGLDFLPQALAAGAAAVAWDPEGVPGEPALPAGVTGLRVADLRAALGELANRFYAQPSQALRVIGITGTNGKTTAAWLASCALGRLGLRAAYMGTLGWGLAPELAPSELTTPDCITLHRRLRELADAGATHVLAEVSSHALAQDRVAGVRFAGAAFSNLSRDHLDYHPDLASYGAAKALLFTRARPQAAVINVGDAFGARIARELPAGVRLLGVALGESDPVADLKGSLLHAGAAGLELELHWRGRQATCASPLWGRFNAENLLLAAGILLAEGHELEATAAALSGCAAPPGRMQRLPGRPGHPEVLVDFAHTPAALALALGAAREHCAGGELWCVFGCGGDRDRGKRAEMGAVASALADHLVLTDDNPRDEDPSRIIDDILAGVDGAAGVDVVPDRVTAIAAAIRGARPGDVVLIAGKGHESTQTVRGVGHPFSDAQVAGALLGRPA
jgi:UDP-N-acetylmuramoyl-L-alanyl-D-glutamate--2,6-diaminopimelate ligase